MNMIQWKSNNHSFIWQQLIRNHEYGPMKISIHEHGRPQSQLSHTSQSIHPRESPFYVKLIDPLNVWLQLEWTVLLQATQNTSGSTSLLDGLWCLGSWPSIHNARVLGRPCLRLRWSAVSCGSLCWNSVTGIPFATNTITQLAWRQRRCGKKSH